MGAAPIAKDIHFTPLIGSTADRSCQDELCDMSVKIAHHRRQDRAHGNEHARYMGAGLELGTTVLRRDAGPKTLSSAWAGELSETESGKQITNGDVAFPLIFPLQLRPNSLRSHKRGRVRNPQSV